jgi:hypothetical protein
MKSGRSRRTAQSIGLAGQSSLAGHVRSQDSADHSANDRAKEQRPVYIRSVRALILNRGCTRLCLTLIKFSPSYIDPARMIPSDATEDGHDQI